MTEMKKKRMLLRIFWLYPAVSSAVMVLIWQIMGRYCTPFLGFYYFRYVDLYTSSHLNCWTDSQLLPRTRILFLLYLLLLVFTVVLTVLIFTWKRSPVPMFLLTFLWGADFGWLIYIAVTGRFAPQTWIQCGEHLIIFLLQILGIVFWFRLRRRYPEAFARTKKKRKKNEYKMLYK